MEPFNNHATLEIGIFLLELSLLLIFNSLFLIAFFHSEIFLIEVKNWKNKNKQSKLNEKKIKKKKTKKVIIPNTLTETLILSILNLKGTWGQNLTVALMAYFC